MNNKQKYEFAKLRLETRLNHFVNQKIQDYADNMVIENTKEGDFIDDGAHAYLIVPPTHPNYMKALVQLDKSEYNYHLADGTVLLEEDCEAPKFISETNKPILTFSD